MVMRSLIICLAGVLAACQTHTPIKATPSFVTSPALQARKPNDIAVLVPEDVTPGGKATRLLDQARRTLMEQLITRRYAPMKSQFVDASLSRTAQQQSMLQPEFLRAMASRSTGDAVLALRIDVWDETRMLADKFVTFGFQSVLVASDGEVLWSGTLSGQVKAGGSGPAPLDREAMARSCMQVALTEMLQHLPTRAL